VTITKKNPRVASVVDAAIEVIKWFNIHSFALGVFNKEQESTYKEIWALIVLVITHWTSHSCTLAHLLQVNKAMKITVTRHEDELVKLVGKKAKTAEGRAGHEPHQG